jgi:hypothetical protein
MEEKSVVRDAVIPAIVFVIVAVWGIGPMIAIILDWPKM